MSDTRFGLVMGCIFLAGLVLFAGACGEGLRYKYKIGQALVLKATDGKVVVASCEYYSSKGMWYKVRTATGSILDDIKEDELGPWLEPTEVQEVSSEPIFDIENGWFRHEGKLYAFVEVPKGVVEVDGKLFDLKDHEFSYKLIEQE